MYKVECLIETEDRTFWKTITINSKIPLGHNVIYKKALLYIQSEYGKKTKITEILIKEDYES